MAREIGPDELYQDKVVKLIPLIPTEIIGAYLFISTGILEISPASPSVPQDQADIEQVQNEKKTLTLR